MAEYTFPELVDIRQLQSLMELFHKATGMPAAIVDVDSTIHVATGWQDICTKFHRVHPVTEARCRESDDYIKSCSNEEGYISYKCRNGLWDLAVPIRIAGEHVASFFCGQLFYEDQPPDYEYFRKQAEEFGFDVHDYLEALSRVPVFSREKVKSIMDYYSGFASLLSVLGYNNLKLSEEIGERSRAQNALQISQERYRLSTKAAKAGVWDWDLKTNEFYIDPVLKENLGYSDEEISNDIEIWTKYVHPDDVKPVMEAAQACFDGKTPEYVYEHRMLHKSGSVRWVLVRGSVIRDEKGNAVRMVGTDTDITERKKAGEKLQESEREKALILDSMSEIVSFYRNRDLKIEWTNRAAAQSVSLSSEELAGKYCYKVWHNRDKPCKDCPVLKAFETGEPQETDVVLPDGRAWNARAYPSLNEKGEVESVVEVIQNITERKQLEEERSKAAKLESIGLLAGGIAHDFNNILTSIMGNISLAKLVAGKDLKEAEELLTESEKASLRAKNLTQQLLTFARGGEPVKKITSLSGLIKDAAEFSLRGSNVQCDYSIPENLWFADVDQGQISQVINNLVINADQAMPDGGTIKVVAANITLQPDHPLPLAQGKYLKISIIDKGTGIPRENRPRIFDPYYTTKQQGSGLGLATSYAIINKHNGHINVESEPEAGSVFHIYLPASDRQPQEKSDIPRGLPFIKGHILVMDDEQMVREVASLMLEHFGHQVGLASEGDEAIRLYQKARGSGRPFDLVIMDLTVPGGMGGQEAVKKLLEIDPEVKAIVSSGYSNDPVLSDYKKHGFRGVVTKPYKLEELKDAVQEVLASQQSDNAP